MCHLSATAIYSKVRHLCYYPPLASVESRISAAFLRVSVSRVFDSPSPASRIGSYCTPSYSPYFKTPYTIFPGFLTVQMAPLATPASFGLFSSLFSSRQSPGRFPRFWLGFFRFFHVPMLVSHVPVTLRRPASTESAPLVPFLHLLILCACRVLAHHLGAAHSTLMPQHTAIQIA